MNLEPSLILLLLAAIPIGIFAVVFGGTMFLSLPVFQVLFPEMTLGALIGNIKPGSVVRNISSLLPLRHHIGWADLKLLLFPLAVGSLIGAFGIMHMTQAVVPVVLVVGFLIMEFASKLAQYLSQRTNLLAAMVIGGYGGIFGAGISLLLVALMRLQRTSEDTEIIHTRADALFLETFLTIISVAVFTFSGLISMPIMLTWASGAIIGGYLGGIILKRTGRLSGALQKNILRVAFMIAIFVAVSQLLV